MDAPALAAACTGFPSEERRRLAPLARNFDFEGGDIFDRQKLVSRSSRPRKGFRTFRRILRDARRRLRFQPRGNRRRATGDRGRRDGGLGHADDAPPRGSPREREHVRGRGSAPPVPRRSSSPTSSSSGTRRAALRGRREEPVRLRGAREHGRDGRVPGSHERTRGPEGAPRRSRPAARIDVAEEARPPRRPAAREPRPLDVPAAIAILRDRRGADGRELGPGNRNAIDASIAAHSVVLDHAPTRPVAACLSHARAVPSGRPDAVLASPGGPPPRLALLPADAWLSPEGYGRYLRSARLSVAFAGSSGTARTTGSCGAQGSRARARAGAGLRRGDGEAR